LGDDFAHAGGILPPGLVTALRVARYASIAPRPMMSGRLSIWKTPASAF